MHSFTLILFESSFESLWFYHVYWSYPCLMLRLIVRDIHTLYFRLKLYSCILVLRTKKYQNNIKNPQGTKNIDTLNKVLK